MKLNERMRRQRSAVGRHVQRPHRAGVGVSSDIFELVYKEVVDRLDTVGIVEIDPRELDKLLVQLVDQAVAVHALQLSTRQKEALIGTISDEIRGLGPLEMLLADSTISDILVNTADSIYIERNGVLEKTEVRFRDNDHLINTINRIVSKVGRRIDEASPMVDARLPDGSRVNAIIPPLALDGPQLSIRRFGTGPLSPEALVKGGTLTREMTHYCYSAVRSRCNILVCGGTGAGKTTLLNLLSHYISSRERIVTIEDSAELQLRQEHVARLESRPPNLEGKGEITIRDLVRNALRMRPDRIIVGEVRSHEVLDMIQAMNTGHEGSMTTLHANNVRDAFTRLMSMLSMAGTNLSEPMMLQMLARAMDVVIHVVRDREGQRRVSGVAEVVGVKDGEIELNLVYSWGAADEGPEPDASTWRCSGHSILVDRFKRAGVPLDARCLRPSP